MGLTKIGQFAGKIYKLKFESELQMLGLFLLSITQLNAFRWNNFWSDLCLFVYYGTGQNLVVFDRFCTFWPLVVRVQGWNLTTQQFGFRSPSWSGFAMA